MHKLRSLVWIVCGCCLSMWAASRTWGYENESVPAIGINGLWNGPPAGLTEEDFDNLESSIDETWKPWVKETAEFTQDLFSGKHPTIEQQRESLQRVKVKLKTLEKALADPRYRKIAPKLSSLYSRLAPAVELSEGVLQSLTADPEVARQKRIQLAFEELHKSVRGVESDLKGFGNGTHWKTWIGTATLSGLNAGSSDALATVVAARNKLSQKATYSPEVQDFLSRASFTALESALGDVVGALNPTDAGTPDALRGQLSKLMQALGTYDETPAWEQEQQVRKTLDEVRQSSPDGGAALAQVVGAAYLNYNLRLGVSEGLMNRFYRENRQERGQIRDRVMEASVYGYQCTYTSMTLDLLPSADQARFAITLSGTVNSNTNGYTSQATVHTVGTHTFRAQKAIRFDGQNFYAEPATVSVRANNRTVGASTKFSNLPLFGRIADNIALNEANSRAPQTNAITASRISAQVRQQLNREADGQFATASRDLQDKRYAPLRKYDMYPDVMAVSTTDKELRLWSRLMGSDEIAGSRPAPMPPVPSDGMVAQLHESLLTHGLERFDLAGKTMTEEELRNLMQSRFSEILGREVKFSTPEKSAESEETKGSTLVFDEHDPVRFLIRDGIVTVIIRAGLKRDNGEDIPTQIITVPLTPELVDGQILVKRGNVGVKPVSRPPNVGAQITRANIMRQKIQSSMPDREIENKFEIDQNGRKVTLKMTNLMAEGGWLTIVLQ